MREGLGTSAREAYFISPIFRGKQVQSSFVYTQGRHQNPSEPGLMEASPLHSLLPAKKQLPSLGTSCAFLAELLFSICYQLLLTVVCYQ